jgi:hypothetical protein
VLDSGVGNSALSITRTSTGPRGGQLSRKRQNGWTSSSSAR